MKQFYFFDKFVRHEPRDQHKRFTRRLNQNPFCGRRERRVDESIIFSEFWTARTTNKYLKSVTCENKK